KRLHFRNKASFSAQKIFLGKLATCPFAPQSFGHRARDARPAERIDHVIARIGQEPHKILWQGSWKPSRVNSNVFVSAMILIAPIRLSVGDGQKVWRN